MVKYISLYGKEEMLLEESMLDFYWKENKNKKVEDFLLNFQEGEIFVLIGEKLVQAFNFNYINTKGALFLIKDLNSQEILCIGSCGKKIAIQIYYLLQKCIELIERESIERESIDLGSLIANLSVSGRATTINYNEVEKIEEYKKTLDKTIQSITLAIIENNKSKIEEISNEIYNLIPINIHNKFEEKYK